MDQLSPEEVASLQAEDRGPLCERIVIAFTVLAVVSVSLRLFTRFTYHKSGLEDYTIIVATLVSIATGVFQILQVRAGNGKHAIFVSYPDAAIKIQKYLWWSIITYNISLITTKISILLQYHRIFTLREMRLPVYVALVIVSVWGLVTIFTAIFTCFPVEAYWDVTENRNGKCVNQAALWYTNASVNIFTDLMVAVIPVRGIWGLQIPRRQKLALLAILTIGWFVCIVSILRVYALNLLNKHPDDPSFYSAPAAYWSAIESNLAIVCASLPALKPLIIRFIPVFGTRNSSRRGSTAASANNHRLQKLGSKMGWRTDDKQQLTSQSVSRIQSVTSDPSESEQNERNIYVTKHFEQRIESANSPRDDDEEVTATEFLGQDPTR